MFVREKRIGSYSYLYLVETVRENGKTKQRIIRNLGRKEVVEAGGDLDRLARSAARLSQRSMILSLVVDGSMPNLTCRRIGAPLLFERILMVLKLGLTSAPMIRRSRTWSWLPPRQVGRGTGRFCLRPPGQLRRWSGLTLAAQRTDMCKYR